MVAGPTTHQHPVASRTTRGSDESTTTPGDRGQPHVSAETFFAPIRHDHVPATGSNHDRVERILVADGFLTRISADHDLAGALTQEHPSC